MGVSLVKFHVFSVIGRGHGNEEWAMELPEWIGFYEELEEAAKGHRTRVWYQPTYARRERLARYAAEDYRGCIGRTLGALLVGNRTFRGDDPYKGHRGADLGGDTRLTSVEINLADPC